MTVEHLEAQLTAQQADIAHLQRTVEELLNNTQPSGGDEPAALRFDQIDDFVDEFVTRHYERPSHTAGDIKWFDCWAQHPSALWTMEILWGSFEEARAGDLEQGGGSNSSSWMVTTFIPLMEWITAHDGPMGLCSIRSCEGPAQLGQTRTYPAGIPA